MPTNKIALRSVEEFMSGYTPIYKPLFPLFMQRSQQYAMEVGKHDFRRVEAVGDLRGKHITPKDTEMQQVSVMEGKKTFKKYFLANQFVQSQVQNREGAEDVVAQVLDEHQLQMDEMFLLGEGSSNGTVVNNGLFYSADPNYKTESSAEVTTLSDLHSKVMGTVEEANRLAGNKIILFYGDDIRELYNSLYSNSDRPFKTVLGEVAGADYAVGAIPKDATPAGVNGWIVANYDQLKLHYSVLPQLLAQGFNEEKMYYWHNFLMGSCMLEVLAKNGVIHQPATVS